MRKINIVLISGLFLALFLAACTTSQTSSNTSATATPIPATATPTTASTSSLTTFQGAGFSVAYPPSWKEQSSSTDNTNVVFNDPQNRQNSKANSFHIRIRPNVGSGDTLLLEDFGTIAAANCNLDNTALPTTTIINGITWTQSVLICSSPLGPYSKSSQIRMLSATNPQANKALDILYTAYTDTFDAEQQNYFQPMLQTVTFS